MSLEQDVDETSPFLEHVRNAPAKPISRHSWKPRCRPAAAVVVHRSVDFTTEGDTTTTTRESDAAEAGRWEEYCDDGLQDMLKKDSPVKRFWKRMREEFPGVVGEVVKTTAAGISRAAFLWGNLGGGMFSYTYYKTAQARRKE